ncbi:energy transducer TonB [Taibaiella helva]|uniref:energy transducer TonB n=1 Tax=Taibaiella helva TaxID=2301235 RepID=UPI0013004E56|nr:energy transducer TonB [Taibaiella helva]
MRLLFSFFWLSCFYPAASVQQEHRLPTADTLFSCGQVETLPVYPGGTSASLQFLWQNLRIPEAVGETAGRMILYFEIDNQGYPRTVKVTRSMHPALDTAVTALFQKMPRWQPAKLRGRPVRCVYTLPLMIHTR